MTSSSSLATPLIPTSTGFGVTSLRFGPLSRYRPLTRLDRGGMAEVFLAAWEVAPHVNRPVVIKRLHTHLSEDPVATQMFLDEARLSCRLEHENVVRTLEAGVIDGSCCIVMEYLEGQALHRVLRRARERGPLSVELAVFITCSVLDALAYAHFARDYSGTPLEIVHRDVSPHNIFVTSDGVVKVLDFGIAKARSHEGQTATGLVKGKIGYIAPEQAMAGEVDPRTDVFATGVVLWEALCGARLFKGDNDIATLNSTMTSVIAPPSQRRGEVPPELDAIVLRALERNPDARYQSAAAMRESLTQFVGDSRADTRALAALMGELFAEELFEQRRLVAACMRESENVPASASYRQPNSTSAMVLASLPPEQGSSVSQVVAEMRSGHRTLTRAALVALGLVLGFGAVLTQRWASSSRPEPVTQPVSAPNAKVVAAAVVEHPQPAAPEPAAVAPPLLEKPEIDAPAPNPIPGPVEPRRARAVSVPSAKLAPEASASARPSESGIGVLTLDSVPWSLVSVDGKSLGQTPLVNVKLPAGVHQLVLRNPELNLQMGYSVTVVAGKTVSRRVGLEP